MVIMFADSGLQTSAITELVEEREGVGARGEILGRLYLCKTMLIAAAALLLAGIGLWVNVTPFVWAIAAWITARTALQSYSQLQQVTGLKGVFKSKSDWSGAGRPKTVAAHLRDLAGVRKKLGSSAVGLRFGFMVLQTFELAVLFLVLIRAGVGPTWPQHLFFWKVVTKDRAPFGISYGLANLLCAAGYDRAGRACAAV